ncbi:beta-1,3-galactosyl-O-glycosyl-glycoprotein beta-1,6-N-acetylglucosaminyltransferase 7-like [Coregonus clupeaformis]|uniref:beta-1,3-galactosyl-O-glycosyl-glycoprotein beta-1,6-N-acetylglucosaminyltransferase 7-like n=1 Tax=Coregonus clupeaformis TaxID=59861 RepID=UPI001E1C31B2|nr:beta-1,3-galactosyl-O-glycosyl-glycoprotein beta-1,6-N-acetylglucosaminyltransferase 7-like [Coregonus clupeaformis]
MVSVRCWIIMLQLDGTKCSFLFCLGICMFICSVIYLSAKDPTDPKGQRRPLGCRPFSQYCQAFLPSTAGSPAWQRHDCQVESYLLRMGGGGRNLDCSRLVRELHFITSPLSREEEDYPLAFILTVHKELELLVRLLRAIYAPQNVYCVHVDVKAPKEYREAVKSLVGCFPNVFLASRSEMVTYAGFSRLQADINCMRDLVESPVPWRKVVNLCGQDFPVKSNLELVRYMQSKEWRDRNMTPGIKQPASMRHRTQLSYREVRGSHSAPKRGAPKKGAPPHGVQIYFGTAYYALTRTFVEFVLRSQVSRDLLEWSKDAFSPDEHYWVTLNHIKEAPGSHVDGGWSGEIRAIKWRDQEGTEHNGCKGRYVRDICIYGLEDLQWIINRNSMFANKFESKTIPEALDCLEQWHRDKVLQQATVPIQSWWQLATQGNTTALFNATVGL